MAEKFFDEQAEQSRVKTAIVAKYFKEWARVITGYQKGKGEKPRVAYIDLFAGPGRYKDGTKSTPLFILEEAVKNPLLCESLRAMFNDRDEENTSSLVEEIGKIPDIKKVKHKPDVFTSEVGTEIVKMFEDMNLIPTLMFVDPWGYKGLSLRLINSVLKNWACECIFFFNYNRINMGLSNGMVRAHMEALFGEERVPDLVEKLEELDPDERELTIVEKLSEALVEMGGKYVLPFGFRNEKGTRTKHHLIFVSKHPLGYKIMKRVMYNESTVKEQGVATFEYSPATERQPLLFEYARPLDALEGMLVEEFAGETVTCEEVVERHNYGRRYIDKNYKDVLGKMEAQGKIRAKPSMGERRKGTFADHVEVTFPDKKK